MAPGFSAAAQASRKTHRPPASLGIAERIIRRWRRAIPALGWAIQLVPACQHFLHASETRPGWTSVGFG